MPIRVSHGRFTRRTRHVSTIVTVFASTLATQALPPIEDFEHFTDAVLCHNQLTELPDNLGGLKTHATTLNVSFNAIRVRCCRTFGSCGSLRECVLAWVGGQTFHFCSRSASITYLFRHCQPTLAVARGSWSSTCLITESALCRQLLVRGWALLTCVRQQQRGEDMDSSVHYKHVELHAYRQLHNTANSADQSQPVDEHTD